MLASLVESSSQSRSRQEQNRRAHARQPLPPSAFYLSDQRILVARLGDLSASGAFLHTRCPDPVGTRATLDFELGTLRACVEVEVVRVSFDGGRSGTGAGMGVAFAALPVAIRRALLQRAASTTAPE